MNGLILTEWIIDAYPHETLETIVTALTKPKTNTKDKTWRITPDVIADWIEHWKSKMFDAKLKEQREQKLLSSGPVSEGWTDERLAELKKIWAGEDKGVKSVPELSKKEIEIEGQVRPKPKRGAVYTGSMDEESRIMGYLDNKWRLAVYDMRTGKRKPNWVSKDEWIKMNYIFEEDEPQTPEVNDKA